MTTLQGTEQNVPALHVHPMRSTSRSVSVATSEAVDVARVMEGHRPAPAPDALSKIAMRLYETLGYSIFLETMEDDAQRRAVSRLWAEDWDSPEDSVYDEL